MKPKSGPLRPRAPYVRTRTIGSLRSLNTRVWGGDNINPYQYDAQVQNVTQAGVHRTTSDTVTPGFKVLQKAGVRINNPYSTSSMLYEPWNSTHTRYWSVPNPPRTAVQNATGPIVSLMFGDPRSDTTAPTIDVDALNKLVTIETWKRVEPAQTQVLVTTAELHKTVNMIHDRAKKLARVVTACRKFDLRSLERILGVHTRSTAPKRFVVWDSDGQPLLNRRGKPKEFSRRYMYSTDPQYLDRASKLWLEYRYGWTPLVYDIVSSLKAIYAADLRKELLSLRAPLRVARAKKEASNSSTVNYVNVPLYGLTYSGNRKVTWSAETTTYIHYTHTAPDSYLRRFNDFGLFDVPLAVWELVPFSFVADWFCPIGDYLAALTPKIGVKIIGSGHTTTVTKTIEQTLTGPASQVVAGITYPPIVPIGSKDTFVTTGKYRNNTLPLPLLPPIEVRLNLKRMADAVALFRGKR